ncbi:MAG: M3 family metallopeptidase, partial [Acidobacteriota bacterium]
MHSETTALETSTAPPRSIDEPPYEVGAWDLSELLPDATDEVVGARLDAIEALVADFEKARPRLESGVEPGELLEILERYERIHAAMDMVAGYASLWFSSDTQSRTAIAFRNRIRGVLTKQHNRILFFSLWWKSLDEDEAARLLPEAPDQADRRRHLEELRRFTPYTLDEKSEQIINIKNADGIDAVVTLYSMLTNRMEFELEVDGEKRVLAEEEMRANFFSTDPDLRERTYRELFRAYERDSNVLAQIYANRVRDWSSEYVELRGFKSPIAVRNLSNDISDRAIETMLDVVERNSSMFQEYFRLKSGWLGMETTRRCDIYAPLATTAPQIPYADAVSDVLETFRDFDPRLAGLAERVFKEGHIDSELRKGKRSGAFCATVLPRFTPWVMVNYTGRVRDVSTLAHELGHAVHSMLAEHH